MTVNNWEGNRCQPRLYLFPKITQFLGRSPFPLEPLYSIGEEIKAYRLMHGLSRKKMAWRLGIDPTTVARWENGKAVPSKKPAHRLNEMIEHQTA
jgi:DNA-binding XRE family transcriptional regulator